MKGVTGAMLLLVEEPKKKRTIFANA